MAALLARLATRASANSDAIAITVADQHTSYAQLWQHSRLVAEALREKGLQPGDRVVVMLPNSSAAAAAIYGCWIAGAVAVPISPQSALREVQGFVRHSDARLLLHEGTDSRAADLRDAGCALVAVSSPTEPTRGHASIPSFEPDSQTLAMLLYTSGTSGRPKGVMITHHNLEANTAAIVDYLGLSPADSVLSVLPFHYSYGSSVLHTHLWAGARVVLEPNLLFPQTIVDTLVREHVTGFSGVPSTYELLLRQTHIPADQLGSLRYLTQAGGAMGIPLIKRVRSSFPKAALFVMYGQTEATARISYLPPQLLEHKPGSVGFPVKGLEVQLRREGGLEATESGPGEIWVRGPSIMQGYWRDQETTGTVLREGWLNTGDLGYRDADGCLYVVGRRSDMIKTGAHRVHPAEVEEVLLELPGVAEAAAVGVEDDLLGESIKVCIVPQAGAVLTLNAVKAHCRSRLASHKVPKHLQIVASLPKTSSGKLMRASLRASVPRTST